MVVERRQQVRHPWGWPSSLTEAVVEAFQEYVEPDGSTGWKRDRWYFVETSSTGSTGTVLIGGPDKNIETEGPLQGPTYGHHGDALSGWLFRDDARSR